VSADAAGSRKAAEAEISGVGEAGRRSVAGEDVVQCAVRAHFDNLLFTNIGSTTKKKEK